MRITPNSYGSLRQPFSHIEVQAIRIVIWGAGGHARVVADIAQSVRNVEIAGFIDDLNLERHGSEFCGSRILGGAEQLPVIMKKGVTDIVIAIGDCLARLDSAGLATRNGFRLVTLCHPTAVVAPTVAIGPG